jgi:hypothetical protein
MQQRPYIPWWATATFVAFAKTVFGWGPHFRLAVLVLGPDRSMWQPRTIGDDECADRDLQKFATRPLTSFPIHSVVAKREERKIQQVNVNQHI